MSELFGNIGSGRNTLPTIDTVKALGSYIYVELLSPKEVLGTSLELTGNVSVKVNEAYVLDIGPQVPKDYGLEIGQRVFVEGGIVFGPDYKDYKWAEDGRKRGMVIYSSAKGRIVEN